MEARAYLVALILALVLGATIRAFTGSWNPLQLVIGADGRPSSSKLQWFLWTVVVCFFYVALYVVRLAKGTGDLSLPDIPQNLLIAMGLSATTMAGAKAITVSYVDNRQITKSAVDPTSTPGGGTPAAKATGPSAVFTDDGGYADLSKIQMLAWTLIALLTFVLGATSLIHQIATSASVPSTSLPDIDASAMVLMGLSQGAYLGKKLVSTDTPTLTGVIGPSTDVLPRITILGNALGDTQQGSQITLDGVPYPALVKVWQDDQVTFEVPSLQASGAPWIAGTTVTLQLVVGGRPSANQLSFTFTDDLVKRLAAVRAAVETGTQVLRDTVAVAATAAVVATPDAKPRATNPLTT